MFEWLPLLRGWRDFAKDLDRPIVIGPNDSYTLEQVREPGWLYSFAITVTGEVTFVLKWFDPYYNTYKTATIDPKNLLELGFDTPNDAGPWVSQWDTATNTYTVCFTPATPLPVYASQKHPRFIIVNAGATGATILGYSQEAIVIYDREAFLESFRELFGMIIPL